MKDIKIEKDEIKKMLNLIYNQNKYIIKKIDAILLDDKTDVSQLSENLNDIKMSKVYTDIINEMNGYFKEKLLTYKQYHLLKYHLLNDYISDTYLSEETGVSYSSISQWKHKNTLFRELYDRIKSLK